MPLLTGVGFFEGSDFTGISASSFAGGAELQFEGQSMSHSPSDFSVVYDASSSIGFTGVGPALSQDNAFNSHTDYGKLQYTSPTAMELMGVNWEDLSSYDTITYYLSLIDVDSSTGETKTQACDATPSNCKLIKSRYYTPLLHYLSPPVVYYGSELTFVVDPKSCQNYKGTNDWPFTEARIDSQVIDFEGFVDELTTLTAYSKNYIRGTVGKVEPKQSADVNFKFKAGNSMHQDAMTRCSYDNSTCYKAKVLAVINSISATSGYTTGGQSLKVTGYGFDSSNINVLVDGAQCEVEEYSQESFTCKTSAKSVPSTDTYYVGQHGLRRKIYNQTTSFTWTSLYAADNYTEMLGLQLEPQVNMRDGAYGNIYSGYFKAPATGNYRFYVTCDDYCQLYLSNADKDPSQSARIYQQSLWANYRNYFTQDNSRVTAWQSLTEGGYYFIEAQHIQATGSDHFTVSVEMDSNTLSGHQHSMREVQQLKIDPVNTREKSNVTILNPDGGTYILNFQNPTSLAYYTTDPISTTASASTFYSAVKGYYSSSPSYAWISVTLTMYASDGTETTDSTLTVKNVYTITVNRALSRTSTDYCQPTKQTTTSSVTFTKPNSYQKSNLPISGSFIIVCQNTDLSYNYTAEIPVQSSLSTIKDRIGAACSQYKDKIDLTDGTTYTYYDDGRDIIIRFVGVNKDIPQFSIIDGLTTPLVGNSITFNCTTMVPHSTNLFYEPIPFEFLYTNETSPQIIVDVDGVEAVCASLNCNYNYVTPTADITDFSLSGQELTITGTSLPTTDIQSIYFSNVLCTISSQSDTSIICTLSPDSITGTWSPVVTDSYGILPLSTSTTVVVPIAITGISPSSDLNPNGGTVIEISGTNFPTGLDDGSTVSISFGDGTSCILTSSTDTLMECETESFVSGTTSTGMTITINGQSDTTYTVVVSTSPATISAITPSYASPVLKSTLVLTVTDFTGTLTKSDLSVKLVSQTNSSYIKAVNVVEVSNTDLTITVKYGGAYSDIYNVYVTSALYGKFDTTGITLQAIGVVTAYSPQTGSVYGGTLITITGYNFSTDITDNPVTIGNTDCLVQSSSNTEITCRTMARDYEAEVSDDFLVFLKTSEEAVCTAYTDCTYYWYKTGLPAVTSYSVSYDSSLSDYVLTITGTDFPTDISDVSLYIDDLEQTVNSTTSTEVKVQIVDMLSSSSTSIDFYLPAGVPEGYSTLTSTGITLTPVFISFSPSEGSPAGTLITAVIKGVGPSTSSVTLVTSSGTEICETVTIEEYGVVYCKTKALTIASNTLKVKVGTTTTACYGTCTYATTTTSMPSVSGVSLSSDKLSIVFTGTSLSLSGFTAAASYSDIDADTVTVDSDTQVTAYWTYGVPHSQSAVSPVLYYESSSSSDSHWASISSTLTNAISATSISSSVTCSFAGGCSVTIDQVGLVSSLSSSLSNITVCGYECELSSSDSTYASAVCSLPALPTSYSVLNYQIVTESYLSGSPFSSSSAYTYNVFDGDNKNGFQDTNKDCYFGTAFTEGYVGVLNEVKYFMNKFTKANYVGSLRFDGSNDNFATYTTVFTVGNEIHEGWNYYSFDDGSELKYRYYRFYGNIAGSCLVGEIGLRGYEAIDNSDSSYSVCTATLNLDGTAVALTGTITYTSTLTPYLTSISPRYGNVVGGETVIFTGENFSATTTDYTISIDGITCDVTAATTTSVTCTTGARPGSYLNDPVLEFKITGYGNVATQDLVFRYASYWSEESTWGGDFQPMDGESIWIPVGLHLLVDIDSSPILEAVLVEGSLIFAPDSDSTHERTFDANYIMVKGGYLEIGTEDFPYTSKLTITMHSDKDSAELPIYGNKVIGVMNGVLDMHGVPRYPTWTELETTALAGDSTITLHTAVDWVAGEKIAIAPTGYDNLETEERTIVSVDNTNVDNPVITLNTPLSFKHYAAIETYGNEFIEMRAEVGLLTRNVVYRGDPETSSKNQYGAHIMLHSSGDESLIGRIEYCEFTDVGQAFQLGRYPLHFHMIGTVHYSYIRGNAIHQTYNRAVTIHGVHYLRILYNVAYKTMGHTFFVEDAVETNNYLEGNLAMLTQRSFSLLNTDTTPASFWITHPDNIFRGNHAAGSDRYGYWFDTKPHSMGPSYDVNVCPENAQLGEFTDNVAHSNGRYGLRIFHKLIPRQYPCSSLIYDSTNTADPYWQNPLVTANFINYTGWKNQENGIIFEQVGDVRVINAKVADNLIAGIEYSMTKDTADGTAMIDGALVIGHSANADDLTIAAPLRGVITARTENFQVHNVNFYNFDNTENAAFGTCSHCFHPAATDSGARHITVSGLYFDSTVPKRIIYQFPYRDIFYDVDGSLTELGAKTWATYFYEHNNQPECQEDQDQFNGLICSSDIEIRRLAMYNYSPTTFNLMEIKLLKYDDSIVSAMTTDELSAYWLNDTAFSVIPFKSKQDPTMGWAIPFVTNHKYKVHWRYGLDFTQMQIDLSSQWKTTDKNIYLVFNFTDVRAKVDVITGTTTVPNATLLTTVSSLWQTGDNIIYNDTSVRQIHLLINGKNTTRTSVKMLGYRCIGSCLTAINETVVENTTRLWSLASSWTSGKVPVAGDTVEVESGWNMIYDVAESPILKYLEINGRLTFEQGTDLHLKSKYIFVRAGELIIGTSDERYTNSAKITLYGEKENEQIVYDNAIEAGNKILVNTGKIAIFGKQRTGMSRLTASVQPGASTIYVETGLGWSAGDKIGLAATSFHYTHNDYAVIVTYDSSTGKTTLDRTLNYYHYGASASTAASYSGLDMRGEVMMLTRNVVIAGEDIEGWGCQILTSDFLEVTLVQRTGKTIIDSAEIYNCSQYDTFKAALRFETASGSYSHIKNSAIHHGLGMGVQITESSNIKLENNIFFDFFRIGVNIQSNSDNITLDGNIVSKIYPRIVILLDGATDNGGGILGCALIKTDYCSSLKFTNNIVAGVWFTGYSIPAHKCSDYTNIVAKDNVAHSTDRTGAIFFKNPSLSDQGTCLEASYFYAYKNVEDGAITYQETEKAVFSNMVFVDNGYSGTVFIGQEGDNLVAYMKNIKIYGESDALDCLTKGKQTGIDRYGLQISYFSKSGKDPLPTKTTMLPVHHVKSDASYGGSTLYESVSFINFKSNETYCGDSQYVFAINKDSADYVPKAKFTSTVFQNVDQSAMGYIMSPNWAWANLDDCGNYPCTAPNNILLSFEKASFTGSPTPANSDGTFQIIANNQGNNEKFKSCSVIKAWNADYCTNEYLGILLFESLDDDKWKRMVSPIKITNDVSGSLNIVNTFMDHIWDGFYTGQLRLSRWPSIIETGAGKKYNISFSGTPPSSQRFTLVADYAGITIRIKYTKTGAYILKDSTGKQYQANAWDDTKKAPADIKQVQCGENRYVGVENTLEFYLGPGCTVYVSQIDSIQASIRMNWTLSEFYADGGTTKFIDRMAASLGIHASNIKVVSVYQGSVIVGFSITETSGSISGGLTTLKAKLSDQVSNGKIWLGAPIIGGSVSSVPFTVVTDSGKTNTTTTTNSTTKTNSTGTPISYNSTKNTTKTQGGVIYEIVDSKEDPGSPVGLIVAIGVIVGVIIISGIAGFFIYRKCKNTKNLRDKKKTIKSQSSDASAADLPGQPEHEEVYEPQYHPKAELGNIFFGIDENKEKVNNADSIQNEVNQNDTQQEEENPDHVNNTHSALDRKAKAKTETDLPFSNKDSDRALGLQMKRRSSQLKIKNLK